MIVPSFGNQNPKSNNEQFGVMKAVTPESLNEIEARAKQSWNAGSTCSDDVLAVVALVRELEQHLKLSDERFQNSCKQVDDQFGQKMEQMGRAEKAEARVKELELEVDVDDQLLAERNRLLKLFECPAHGDQCVPYAVDQVVKLRAVVEAARYLRRNYQRRISDPRAWCTLTETILALDGDAKDGPPKEVL